MAYTTCGEFKNSLNSESAPPNTARSSHAPASMTFRPYSAGSSLQSHSVKLSRPVNGSSSESKITVIRRHARGSIPDDGRVSQRDSSQNRRQCLWYAPTKHTQSSPVRQNASFPAGMMIPGSGLPPRRPTLNSSIMQTICSG